MKKQKVNETIFPSPWSVVRKLNVDFNAVFSVCVIVMQ